MIHACEVLAETGTCPHIDGQRRIRIDLDGTTFIRAAIEDVLASRHLERRVEQYQRRARRRAIAINAASWLILAATAAVIVWVVVR